MQASRIVTSRSSPAFPHTNPVSPDHNHHHELSRQREQRRSSGQRAGKANTNVKRKEEGNGLDGTEETNWLLRTASSIATSSLEEDGLGWLGKRESSTSLHELQNVEDSNVGSSSTYRKTNIKSHGIRDEGGPPENATRLPPSLSRKSTYSRMHSGRTSRTVSKPGSRAMSRVSLSLPEEELSQGTAVEEEMNQGVNAKTKKVIQPDWIFPEEIQRVEEELRDREEEDHGDEEERIGEESKEEGFNEAEMKKVVLGRVGGWVDWAVGWMGDSDGRREEGATEADDDDDEGEDDLPLEEVDEAALGRKGRKSGDQGDTEEERMIGDILPPPPTAPASVMIEGGEGGSTASGRMWDDAKWLLSVARQVAFT